ncbi:unnamed protein product [Nezara viridula]|uniref:Uncharacterized protein n=1 Tax=Nezara viridula TaxID=85310 RepID=A0A9P0HPB5_NEZVI|nr:unnamed protein product [Nezara viridula]
MSTILYATTHRSWRCTVFLVLRLSETVLEKTMTHWKRPERDVTSWAVGCELGRGGGILRRRAAVTSCGVATPLCSRPYPTSFGSVNGGPSSIWLESFGRSIANGQRNTAYTGSNRLAVWSGIIIN